MMQDIGRLHVGWVATADHIGTAVTHPHGTSKYITVVLGQSTMTIAKHRDLLHQHPFGNLEERLSFSSQIAHSHRGQSSPVVPCRPALLFSHWLGRRRQEYRKSVRGPLFLG